MKITRTMTAVLAFSAASALWAQQPAPTPPPSAHKMDMPAKPGMTDDSMMARHKEMMAKMDAMDARLDDLAKQMDAAKGEKKADAVAAVVSELVRQRKEIRGQMMAMAMEMTKGTMECPMMKGSMECCQKMKGMDGKSPSSDGHSQHHPD
jgi:hypothetical protein